MLKKIILTENIKDWNLEKGQIVYVESKNKIKEAEKEVELPNIKITDEIRVKILDYLKEHEITDDEKDIHSFAEKLNMNPHQLELEIYKIVQCFLRGGKAFEKGVTESDVDKKQLDASREVELEHFDSKNPYAKYLAPRVGLDHLSEIGKKGEKVSPKDSKYYLPFLKDLEDAVKKDAEGK